MESWSSNTVVTEGNNVILHCNATGNPTPNIIWRRNANSAVLHQGQNYIMYNINRNQAGNYICSAWNGIGNKKNATITVTVHCKLNLVLKTWWLFVFKIWHSIWFLGGTEQIKTNSYSLLLQTCLVWLAYLYPCKLQEFQSWWEDSIVYGAL